jgi:hypothetical protein
MSLEADANDRDERTGGGDRNKGSEMWHGIWMKLFHSS